ncbi:uncharacterized protein M6B38_353590 [Iris pallida]|uniref:Uncharacterized protein n=1 Tax=Iris pallida TaxID=29817 RepID=A0AAX6GNK1_IRIPA|nr:uncharacterized protein M6B38_353590 [Iris pallida]
MCLAGHIIPKPNHQLPTAAATMGRSRHPWLQRPRSPCLPVFLTLPLTLTQRLHLLAQPISQTIHLQAPDPPPPPSLLLPTSTSSPPY